MNGYDCTYFIAPSSRSDQCGTCDALHEHLMFAQKCGSVVSVKVDPLKCSQDCPHFEWDGREQDAGIGNDDKTNGVRTGIDYPATMPGRWAA